MNIRLDKDGLRDVRANTDWRELFTVLDIKKDQKKSRECDWWGISPFSPEERTASFHMNDYGWYCHSTAQGGGPIELVQRIEGGNCYEAGRWLLDHGVSHVQTEARRKTRTATTTVSETDHPRHRSEGRKVNTPIRQDLCPQLERRHTALLERGIADEVLEELGIGFYAGAKRSKSPLRDRLVFQIRGVHRSNSGTFERVVLSHIGRATTKDQERDAGKWHFYPGFHASIEVYNQDILLRDDEARRQSLDSGHVLIVEGCFDVAKLLSAGIRNVVATFGGHLSEGQVPRLKMISEEVGVDRFLVFFDRDQDGTEPNRQGAGKAVELLTDSGFGASSFVWDQRFLDRHRGRIGMDEAITDPCDFSIDQLRWLRSKGRL